MKYIKLTICLILSLNINAQEIVNLNLWNQLPDDTGKYYADLDNNFDYFIGTWEYQNGNQTFQIILSKVTQEPYYDEVSPKFYADGIEGHFKMILNKDLPNESILYRSDKKIGNTNDDWPNVIRGKAIDNIVLSGLINDNSGVFDNEYPMGVRGNMIMTISAGSSPPTASWVITLPQGMYGFTQPKTFIIPTNIILTKVN